MLRTIAAIALAASPNLLAQGTFDLDKTSPGSLGAPLSLAWSGATANSGGFLMVSFTGGPTPISPYDPNDPRSVQVGVELSGSWLFVVNGASGSGTHSLALPNNPAYHDLVLHWQLALLATSGPTMLGAISNDVVTQASTPQQSLLAHSVLGTARAFGAGFFDTDNNNGHGDFVVAGGGSGSLTSATGLASTEVWDFRHMRAVAGASLNTARALHLAVRLNDGRVLLSGGADSTGAVLASCEIYDPATNTYTATGSMATARILHAATLLNDGRVMVAGGTSSLVDTTTAITSTLNSVEFYNPATGTWSNGPAIGGRRLAPALTTLPSGQVLVSGGVEVGFLFGIPISAVSTTATQRWTPATNAWTAGPAMAQGRAGHHFNQVRLNDGRILMSGGTYVPSLLNAAAAAPINGAELYNPTTNTWATANMATARTLHSANVLPNGDVVVCGGAQGTLTAPTSIDGVELFHPASNTWSALAPLLAPRSGHAAAVLPDGTLVLLGGQDATATTATVETLRF